jgi:hypothetical protein
MIRIFKILLLTLVLIAPVLKADAGDRKIRLLGNIKESMPQRISPRVSRLFHLKHRVCYPCAVIFVFSSNSKE